MDVLVDLTPLDSAVRFRGIGRYVACLGAALADLDASSDSGPELVALTALRAFAAPGLDATCRWQGEPRFRTYPACHHVYRWRRRLLLDRAAARSGARIWHQTDPTGTPLRRSVPRVVTCFDLIPLVMHEAYLAPRASALANQRALDRRRYADAARVLAISPTTKRDLVEQLGIDPDRIDVTPLGVNHALFHPRLGDSEEAQLRQALGLRRPFLLYVGGADERKNVAHLVRAFARSGIASDVDLVLAGDVHRTQLPDIRRAIDDGRVTHAARVLGFVDDATVAALYRTCLAHACLSLYEGFGLTVLESLACGAPTLTTRSGALADVAAGAALLVGGVDEDETVAALRRVVSDAELRASLSARGPTQAAGFRWSRCAEATAASYLRALSALA